MLRETRARLLAVLTALLVVLLAALFAWLRNLPAPARHPVAAPATTLAEVADPRLEQGERAFKRLDCGRCHSIGGRGNLVRPLDGVGRRLEPAAIRAWTTGTGAARDQLPTSVARMKAQAADDPELDVLVDYLAHLK